MEQQLNENKWNISEDIVKIIVFADAELADKLFLANNYDKKQLALMKIKIGLTYQDIGMINQSIQEQKDKDTGQMIESLYHIKHYLKTISNAFPSNRLFNSQSFLLQLIQSAKRLSHSLINILNSQFNNEATLQFPTLNGQNQIKDPNFDYLLFVNRSLSFVQDFENRIYEDFNQNPLQVFNKTRLKNTLKHEVLKQDLRQKSMIYLFTSFYTNRISNAIRFINEQLPQIVKPMMFLEQFAFRLIYELIRRDYLNKAFEIIKAMGWKQVFILKSILYYSSDKRICKMVQNHLFHKNKLTKEELYAIEIKQFIEILYPITSVFIQKHKLMSKISLNKWRQMQLEIIQDNIEHNFKSRQHSKNVVIGDMDNGSEHSKEDEQEADSQSQENINATIFKDSTEEEVYLSSYLKLRTNIDISDLNFYTKDKEFKLLKLNRSSFIDQIFEFKEDINDENNEDEFFSKRNCKLQGPPCKECERFLTKFEDLGLVFHPSLLNDDLPSKYFPHCFTDIMFEDKGYAIQHTSWIITILRSLQPDNKDQTINKVKIEEELLQPLILEKYKREMNYRIQPQIYLQALIDFCIRANSYYEFEAFVGLYYSEHLREYLLNYIREVKDEQFVMIKNIKVLTKEMPVSQMFQQRMQLILAKQGILEEDDLVNIENLISKLAQIKLLFPKFNPKVQDDIKKLLNSNNVISHSDPLIKRLKLQFQDPQSFQLHHIIHSKKWVTNLLKYFLDNLHYNIALEFLFRVEMCTEFNASDFNIDNTLFKFYQNMQTNISLASQYQADFLSQQKQYGNDDQSRLIRLSTIFYEKKPIMDFKDDIEQINSKMKLKTLQKLIKTRFDQEISQQEYIGTFEEDMSLDQLVSLINDQISNYLTNEYKINFEQGFFKRFEIGKLTTIKYTKQQFNEEFSNEERLEYYIFQGRVIEAFQIAEQLPIEDLSLFLYQLSLQHILNIKITTSCILLLQLLGQEPSMLKIDLATAKRILTDKMQSSKNSQVDYRKRLSQLIWLQECKDNSFEVSELTQEEEKQASLYLETVDLFLAFINSKKTKNEEQVNKSLLSILKNLEKSTWNIEDSKKDKQSTKDEEEEENKSPSIELQLKQRDSISDNEHEQKLDSPWHLVGLYCKVHDLPPSLTLLHELARKNDWIMFLYEAQQQQCPKDTVLDIINDYFQSNSLKKHLKVIFKESSSQSDEGKLEIRNKRSICYFQVPKDEILAKLATQITQEDQFNLFEIVSTLQKYLSQQKKEKQISHYINMLAILTKRKEFLLLSQLFIEANTFEIVFITLHLDTNSFSKSSVQDSYTLEDFEKLLLSYLKQKDFEKVKNLIEIYNPQNPLILFDDFINQIARNKHQQAQKTLLNLLLDAKDETSYDIGNFEFIQKFINEAFMYLYFECQQQSIQDKQQALSVIYEVYKEFEFEEKEVYRKLIVKYKYLQILKSDQPEIIINHSEMVELLWKRGQYDEARSFIKEYLYNGNSDEISNMIDFIDLQQIYLVIQKVESSIDSDEKIKHLNLFLTVNCSQELIIQHLLLIVQNQQHLLLILYSEPVFEWDIIKMTYMEKYQLLSIIQTVLNMQDDEDDNYQLRQEITMTKEAMYYNLIGTESVMALSLHKNINELKQYSLDNKAIYNHEAQTQPNLQMLLSKDKSSENVQFLERISITLLNMNLTQKAFDFASYFNIEIKILRSVKNIKLKIDQLQKGNVNDTNSCYGDISRGLDEIEIAYPQLSLFLMRVRNCLAVNRFLQGNKFIMFDDESEQQKDNFQIILEEEIKLDKDQYDLSQGYYRYQNISDSTLLFVALSKFMQSNRSYKVIKRISKLLQQSKDTDLIQSQITEQIKSRKRKLEDKISLLCLIRCIDSKSHKTQVVFYNKQIYDIVKVEETDKLHQYSIINYILSKIKFSQASSEDSQLQDLIYSNLLSLVQVIGNLIVQSTNDHVKSQVLCVLQRQQNMPQPMMKLYMQLLQHFKKYSQLNLIFEKQTSDFERNCQYNFEDQFSLLKLKTIQASHQELQGMLRNKSKTLHTAEKILKQLESFIYQ